MNSTIGQHPGSATPSPGRRQRTSLAAAPRGQHAARGPREARRRVLFVTSELSDFVKAGGLGDVSAALPRALRDSQDVRVLLPGYRSVLRSCMHIDKVGRVAGHAGLPACEIGLVQRPDGLQVLVLLHPDLYEREGGSPYVADNGDEWTDNAVRFATLSHAAAEIAAGRAGLSWKPDLLHLNDWPCALAAAYLDWENAPVPIPSVLTIHNLAYQGNFPRQLRAVLGLPEQAAEAEMYGQLSFLRAGLAHADYVTTVSHSYADQITQPQYGCGLHVLLQRRAAEGRLTGIVNGIDASWDPAIDPHLEAHFSPADWEEGRRANAAEVRQRFGLLPSRGPLFVVVSRLVHQKGLDLVCEVTPRIVAAGGQLAVIGRGEPLVEQAVQRLARRFPGRVGAHIGFVETLARRMFAGADFLLMPSRFEPCGLSQMYAQRYGCLPIAHATGGLVDTIEDGITGLLFAESTPDSLRRCLQRAFRIYAEPDLLHAMRRLAMLEPHGWDRARLGYEALYQQAAPIVIAAA
ncbi:glycogen synthase GlgA [Frateuria defendens]|uniref:glycogen synthase GlgA n=1 Tax=Frateuria defendens TaxID=2219559 RepID=UPI00066FCDF0|nr:glycogen synthase GlgA [Frateuria defendens]